MRFIINIFIVGLLLVSVIPALAFTIPANDGFVTDEAGVLLVTEERQIEDLLRAYQQETSNEIAVLIVNSMEGDAIADSAFETGRKWGIGTKEFNNGILFLIAIEDRKLFLATGYGLEGAIPDIVAKGIIDEEITPYFKKEKYADGIIAGIDSIKKHIGGEYTSDRYSNSGDDESWQWIFFVLFFAFQWLVAIFARTKSWWLGGVVGAFIGVILAFIISWWWAVPIIFFVGLLLDFIVSKNYKKNKGKASWWAGGSGGWGSGGSGGFGGGSFGGGGAGGSW